MYEICRSSNFRFACVVIILISATAALHVINCYNAVSWLLVQLLCLPSSTSRIALLKVVFFLTLL